MISATEKLRKFLQLEKNKNYDNRAVVGGMDKFLPIWQRESAMESLDPSLITKVNSFLSAYGENNNEGRETAIAEILEVLPAAPAHNGQRENRRHERHENRDRNDSRNNRRESTQKANKPIEPDSPMSEEKPTEKPVDSEPMADTKPATPVVQEPVVSKAKFYRERKKSQPSRLDDSGPTVESDVCVIPGIGSQNAKALAKQGVFSVRDFLYYFPRRYDDYSQFKTIAKVQPGEVVTIIGMVTKIDNFTRGKYLITECVVGDGTGFLRISWFNQQWIIHQIRPNQAIVLSGKIDVYLGRPVMNSPDWETSDQESLNTNRIVPVYAINANLKQNFLRRIIFNTVRHWSELVPEFIPEEILESADLLPLQTAIAQIHFPDSQELLKEARDRLAFDEIFLLQLSVLEQKRAWTSETAAKLGSSDERVHQWVDHLPFQLTTAQWKAISDIRWDMASGKPMSRLVQGDVGSGKTVVAAVGCFIANDNNGQSVIMAPTSVLAEQHYRSFQRFISQIGEENLNLKSDQVELLVGSTPEAKKREIRDRLKNGEIKICIGTHALIESPIEFQNLQFVVIDEQHRFGVEQRATLRSKGTNPHLLAMTATPIPRSLALTVYGDLDLTVIDEMPAGRIPIETNVVTSLARERVYRLISREVEAGHQAFIIYPLVEEDGEEDREGKAAVEAYEKLQNEIFPDLRVALLHGRMRPDEKDETLFKLTQHEYDVLVSTSVIEVGVDVPDATVILIEGADRFGLAQLHQFRGRVGRSSNRSYCILIPQNDDAVENSRLQAMTQTSDGFKLAEMDLDMRGPGDFLGKRQSGFMDLKMASLTDVRLIEKSRNEAQKLFAADPDLSIEGHNLLKNKVEALLKKRAAEEN